MRNIKSNINNVEIYDYCPPNILEQTDKDKPNYIEAAKFNRFLYRFRLWFTVCHGNWSAQKYLRSHANVDNEKYRQIRYYPFAIHPFSQFRHWWNIFMVLVINIGLIMIPYEATFDITRKTFKSWNIVKHTIISICICDIVVNFFTGYFDRKEGITILQFKKIVIHYSKNLLIFDTIGSIPTDLIFIFWPDLIVAREMASYIFIFRFASLMSYYNRISQCYRFRWSLFEFLSAVYWFTIIVHWLACIYWMVPVAMVSMTLPQKPQENSWMNVVGLKEDAEDIDKYTYSLLRSIATMTHSGFMAETESLTSEDQWLVIIYLGLSVPIICFLLAFAMQLYVNTHSSKLDYESMLANLQQYMAHKQLPSRTQKRMKEYQEYIFHRRFFREAEILSTLSINIRQEHRMQNSRNLVENVVFLNILPLSLLARLVTLLKAEIYLTNDVIFEANETGNCMYFIAAGTVAVFNADGEETCHLMDGAHFGGIAIIVHDAKRVATIVAVETCKLYKLERLDFAKIIHQYPVLWERIKTKAINWHEQMGVHRKRV